MTLASLASVTLNCAERAPLVEFWIELLGGKIVYESENGTIVSTGRGAISMVRVDGYEPPTWPGGPTPNHIHLDLAAEDLDAAEAEAVRLGAKVTDEQPNPDLFRVLLDPAGHPFCLTKAIPLGWPPLEGA
ncbi:MAG: hypothetical protein JWQ81_3947 [Amycolatopsis sp.]|jgi:hypothetical protein|uniref:VOC family protein n=1 Tax=Amycolatopsis sp. TaxID=37632 RepID=UPI002628F6C5|nr:VOC family protein [Amycolatopsis sp.]MCU1683208.1 hypothetical protein [Amycolatopsis sp.]